MTSSLDHTLDELTGQLDAPVVTIGNFDGVHLGHREILECIKRRADSRGVDSVAVTFEPHPVTFFRHLPPESFRLTALAQKLALLRQLGVDHAIALPFGRPLASLTPEAFVDRILHQVLAASEVWVGYDFNFGKGRSGSPEDLTRLGQARGIEVHVHAPVEHGGEVVSSTRIRKSLQAGELAVAESLLGRPHSVVGEVVRGDARGKGLGFPTANLLPQAGMMVPHGVYITRARDIGTDESWPAVTNIGLRPTFGQASQANVESFILHGLPPDADLYGRRLEVVLLRYVRPEVTFASVDALKAQIALDVAEARRVHGLR